MRKATVSLLFVLASLFTITCLFLPATPIAAALPVVGIMSSGSTGTPEPSKSSVSTVSPTAAPCPPEWSIVTSANVSGSENALLAISAVSPADMWAAGYAYLPSPGVTVRSNLGGAATRAVTLK